MALAPEVSLTPVEPPASGVHGWGNGTTSYDLA